MVARPFNVLFLCTGNSARSIMAEALLNCRGGGRFRAFSAGSHPKGDVDPLALETLRANRIPSVNPRSKSWDEFAGPNAPAIDFVFTVCDHAAQEACPIWPGHPITAHWGIADPAGVQGSEQEKTRAFSKAFRELDARVQIFTSLPLDSLDKPTLKRELEAIGQTSEEDSPK
jgi:arsenate reductase